MKSHFSTWVLLFCLTCVIPCRAQDSWVGLDDPDFFMDFIIHPEDSNILYATSHSDVYKSINGGASWTSVYSFLYTYMESIVINPRNTDTMYVGMQPPGTGARGIYRSANRGNSWTKVVGDTAIHCLAIDPVDPRVVYAGSVTNTQTGSSDGVIKTVDAGDTWYTKNNGLSNLEINALEINPDDPHILYAGTGSGVFISKDSASSWDASSSGLPGGTVILSLEISSHDTSLVFAGTSGDGLYRSEDGGRNWSAANSGLTGLQVNFIAVHPTAPHIVYAGLDAGFFQSENFGVSWTQIDENGIMFGGDVGVIRFNPKNPEWVYALFSINSSACQIFKRRFTIPCIPPVIELQSTGVTCHGDADGAIDLTVTGGSPPYTYEWSTGETTEDLDNLGGGTYRVTVTDNEECEAEDSIYVNEPEPLTAEITDVVHVSDSGGSDGSATVTASGGTLPYSYLWDDDATTTEATAENLCAKRWFRVTVTDGNGCMAENSVMLTEPGVLCVDIIFFEDISCHGEQDGSATASITGGTEPFSILWDDPGTATTETVNGLGPGWYRVGVTDANSKTALDSVYITEPAPLAIEKDCPEVICAGTYDGYIDLSVSGGTKNYGFAWSNGKTTEDLDDLPAGEYSVTVTDHNGCILQDTTRIDSIDTYEGLEICMVTVIDGVNLVVWERPDVPGIDHFRIYRHTVDFGYVEIGRVPYDSLSILYDYASVPEEISHFYKISTVDICGNESSLSPYHKTMHLTANLGTSGEVNLIWENYEGFVFPGYDLFRGSDPGDLSEIRSLPSNVTSFTDNNHPAGTLYYRTQVERPEPCFPSSAKKAGTGPYYHSLSNMDDNKLQSGIGGGIRATGIEIFPNPAGERVTVRFDNPGNGTCRLTVRDVTGKVIRTLENLRGNSVQLRLEGIPPGIYIIRIDGTVRLQGMLAVE